MPKAQRTTALARNYIASAMPSATAWHALIETSFDAGVQKPPGYCWRTPQCRNLSVQHAFFEGQKAREMCARKGASRTLKEIRQQYPPVISTSWKPSLQASLSVEQPIPKISVTLVPIPHPFLEFRSNFARAPEGRGG